MNARRRVLLVAMNLKFGYGRFLGFGDVEKGAVLV